MQPVVPSTTDVTVSFFVYDATTFLPYDGLTAATSGLALSYRKGGTGAETAITEANLSALTDAHSDGGIKFVRGAEYRLDLPDAAVPTAENEVTTWGGTATGYLIFGGELVGRTTPLAPTTAGRTLDVSAGGEAGVDWANVGSPTTTVGLSGTTVGTATTIGSTGVAAIWAALTSALTTAGSIGAYLVARLATAGIAITNRGLASGGLRLIQGDAYLAADSSNVTFTFTNSQAYDLDATAGRLTATNHAGDSVTITASFAQAGTTVTVTLGDVTAATSAAWTPGRDYHGQLEADVSVSGPVTVLEMTLEIVADIA